MKKLVFVSVMIFGSLFSALNGKEYKLMDNGKACCQVIVPEGAIPAYSYAAEELSKYLGKISGSNKGPAIVKKKSPGMYGISFAVTEDKEVKEDGFRLTVNKNGILIEHRKYTPVGALYGAYEILKKYGGIYWLLPADDGEYYSIKPTIAVPEQKTVRNPFMPLRSGNNIGLRSWGRQWVVRNNMTVPAPRDALNKSLDYQRFAAKVLMGYHSFSKLLTGEFSWDKVRPKEVSLYKEHPEYFPLLQGKRVPINYGNKQPCTSNSEVIKIFRENLQKTAKDLLGPDGTFLMYNNDSTAWCTCDNCTKLDTPAEKKDGKISERYWTFIHAITKDLWKKYPETKMYVAAYQTFHAPPVNKNLIPPQVNFALSFNRTCWRHDMDDPKCLTNTYYDALYKEWAKLKRHSYSFDELYFAGNHYLPVEESVMNRWKYYKKIDCEFFPEVFTLIEANNKRYTYMQKNSWRAIWQTMYLIAAVQWDDTVDAEKLYEKINSLYYGKAWNGGMRELRKYMIKVFRETPGCTGHGSGNPLGKMLEKPGVHQKILDLFAEAEKAAKLDPDKRALEHVKLDRKFFELTWEKAYRDYTRNYREINAYRKCGNIVIDGNLNDEAWKNADIVSSFTDTKNPGKVMPLNEQTYVRIAYEPDYIYFAIEGMEPTPEKMVSKIENRDGNVWDDNTFEILISHPDMGENYYQMIFNAKGNCYDHIVKGGRGDRSFDYNGKFAVKVLKDRWILEGKLFADALGEKCFDGQIWKINILRRRFLTDSRESRVSSWSMGSGHSVAAFHAVNFAGERKNQNVYHSHQIDKRFFLNGSFNELWKASQNSNLKYWNVPGKIAPKYWAVYGSLKGRTLEMLPHPDRPKDHFVRTNGTLFQHYKGAPGNLKLSFRAKGKGTLDVWGIRNPKDKKSPRIPSGKVYYYFARDLKIDSDKWQTYTYEYKNDLPEKNIKLTIGFAVKNGMIDLDDVSVVPVSK